MGLVEDFRPILRASKAAFLRSRRESGDVHSFEFEVPPGICWKPGQHGLFTFPQTRVRGRFFRVFSIASAPGDQTLRIAPRIITLEKDVGWSEIEAQLTPIYMGTIGEDLYGLDEDTSNLNLSQAWLKFKKLWGHPFNLTVGMQDIDPVHVYAFFRRR